jgi:hypothetical protein
MGMAVVTRYNSFLLGIVFASITWAVILYLYSVITQDSRKLATTSKAPFVDVHTPDNSENFIDFDLQNQEAIILDEFFLKSPPPKKSNPKAYAIAVNDINVPLQSKAEGKSAYSLKNAYYWNGYKNSDALIHKLQPKTLEPNINEVGMVKTAEDQVLRSEGYKVHAFNVLVSRELSYHREIPDTRHHL